VLNTLPAGLEAARLYEQCGQFLVTYKQEGSYAITVLYLGVPTCILGFPRTEDVDITSLNLPSSLGILLVRDFLELAMAFSPTMWRTEKVQGVDNLTLQKSSLGLSDCIHQAGSFGGYVKKGSSVLGMTCALQFSE
jgi:hypothetical protein